MSKQTDTVSYSRRISVPGELKFLWIIVFVFVFFAIDFIFVYLFSQNSLFDDQQTVSKHDDIDLKNQIEDMRIRLRLLEIDNTATAIKQEFLQIK